MRRQLVQWVRESGGVSTRTEALRLFPSYVVDDAVNDGALARLLPCTYVLPELAQDRGVLRRAALAYRPDAALSHLDALAPWTLPGAEHARGPVDAATSRDQRECKHPLLTVHRRCNFRNEAPDVVVRDGLRTVRLEQAIIDSWARLPLIDQRLPTIVALRERRTTGQRLLETLARNPRVKGAADMRRVFELVAGGCHSPLELWGHENVFATPQLAGARRQHPLVVGGRTFYLDRYYDEALLAVELDGAAYHGTAGQRERDLRRDAGVATLGIQTLRFSHQRLFGEPAAVRAETLEVIGVRRRQFARTPA